jgi:FKBP-type peptidyl-prolyl cis-trans isomerase FklB
MKFKFALIALLAVPFAVLFNGCGSSVDTDSTKSMLDSLSNPKNLNKPAENINYALGVAISQDFKTNYNATLENIKLDEFVNALVSVLSDSVDAKKTKDAVMAFNDEVQKNGTAKQSGAKMSFGPKFSVNAGFAYGNGIKSMGFSADMFKVEEFKKAFTANMSNATTEMDFTMAQTIIQQESGRLMAAQGEKNLEAGKKFMAENLKKNPKLKTTPSGMQYEILKEGNGPKPAATDKVLTHYHGTKIDGTVFDSSVDRGQPSEFALNQVIKGWTEILQLMPKGSKWRVFIPSDLAYGAQGSPGGIPPNSTLIFEIELFKINGK